MAFLAISQAPLNLEDLRDFAAEKKANYLKHQAALEKEEQESYVKDNALVLDATFSWEEMMEVLDSQGGWLTFRSTSTQELFSRYNKDGHLISTIGRDYYQPLSRVREENLAPYKLHTFKIDNLCSSWTTTRIAMYLRERMEQVC